MKSEWHMSTGNYPCSNWPFLHQLSHVRSSQPPLLHGPIQRYLHCYHSKRNILSRHLLLPLRPPHILPADPKTAPHPRQGQLSLALLALIHPLVPYPVLRDPVLNVRVPLHRLRC